jgi:hypothetical protein
VLLLSLYFIVMAAFSGFEATFALFSERRFGFTVATIGYLFAFIGITLAIVQGCSWAGREAGGRARGSSRRGAVIGSASAWCRSPGACRCCWWRSARWRRHGLQRARR